jgi:integrase
MNNLSLLFSTVITDDEPIKLLDGAVTLYKRPNSHQWQCRFKLSTGAWHSASTGSDQVAEATTQAIAIYETVKVKLASDLAIKTKYLSAISHARVGCSCPSSPGQSQ